MRKSTRQEFLKVLIRGLAAVGVLSIVGPVIAYLFPAKLEEMPAEPVMVGAAEDFPLGTSQTVRFGRYPALVISTPNGLRAYSAVCTHFSCICKWEKDKERIVCPCHDGNFSPEDGSVLAGPPPEPLKALPIQVVDGKIYIGGQG